MRHVFLLGLNDLRMTLKDRQSLIWMLLLPIFMMWIFSNMNMGSGGTAKVSLGLVDEDGGWLARAFVEELASDKFELREMTPAGADSTESKVRTLIIPAGFTEGVLAAEKQILRLEKEPGTSSDYGLAAEVHIFRAIVRSLARLVEMEQSGALASGDLVALASFDELGRRESLVDLAVSTAGAGRPVPSGAAQSVPGTLTMIVLMMTVIYGGVYLTTEKQSGMLLRQMTLPVVPGQIILGKLAGRLMIALAQALVLLAAGWAVTRISSGQAISYGNSPLGLAVLLLSYCIACTGLATLVGAVLRTPEQASAVGWISSMGLAALGGCWWPSEVTPGWLQTASHLLPTTWAMDGFHALISFGYGLESVLVPSAVLLGFGLLFSLLGTRFLRSAGAGA